MLEESASSFLPSARLQQPGPGQNHPNPLGAPAAGLAQGLDGRKQLSVRGKGLEVSARVTQGDPAEEILSDTAGLGADLVVVGSHGHSALYDVVVGGVAEALLRRSICPVLIVPAHRAKARREAGSAR